MIMGDEGVPVQVDGEAWIQAPGYIRIMHKNRAQMLTRDRVSIHQWCTMMLIAFSFGYYSWKCLKIMVICPAFQYLQSGGTFLTSHLLPQTTYPFMNWVYSERK